MAVADVFDALSSARPYKPAWPLQDAADHLRAGRGSHFDPQCVDAFLGAWAEVIAIHQRFDDADSTATQPSIGPTSGL